ncbi:hypothetical protein APA66_27690 [Pseudomonas aeruginosa]|uniref:hypothetical protein n=1 Tax=Pseudomonas aeruginosa TaxID=287 RepID=UPI00071C0B3D|nr:hypothetical protein [Pseudomonas aeruginosa]KSM44958.1 hypothetical protein APA66_27690 [Pseudomonas aeruginosa]HBO1825726.1 hypothetical protein [Pseudomonas aeruginosa]HEI9901566.1 hypothetical protein [Pseudomonas aeruginosa]
MSKQSYTPGPWDYWSGYNPVDELEAQITTEDGDIVIASYNRQIPEGEANAKLLAAAPDLLEALQACIQQITALCSADDVPDQARAAIAKATA